MTSPAGRYYGLVRKRPDRRDYRFRAPRTWTGEHVDLSDGFVATPYDQLNLGSCVANGGGAAADFALKKQGQPALAPPSRLFLYYQGRIRGGYPIHQDTGLQIRDAFNVLAKDGAPAEESWPYVVGEFDTPPPASVYDEAAAHQATVYGAVDPDAVDDTIASGYPVVFGFDVYESFEDSATESTGVVPVPDKWGERYLGAHCMVAGSTRLDGSDPRVRGVPGVKYRKTLNSWGLGWGLDGWCWFPTSEFDNGDASDCWMVTTFEDPAKPAPPPAPTPPAPWPCHWPWGRALFRR